MTYFVCLEDFGAIVNCGGLGAKGAKVCSIAEVEGVQVQKVRAKGNVMVGHPMKSARAPITQMGYTPSAVQITRAVCMFGFPSDNCIGEAVHSHR